jgi:hypothetical protein
MTASAAAFSRMPRILVSAVSHASQDSPRDRQEATARPESAKAVTAGRETVPGAGQCEESQHSLALRLLVVRRLVEVGHKRSMTRAPWRITSLPARAGIVGTGRSCIVMWVGQIVVPTGRDSRTGVHFRCLAAVDAAAVDVDVRQRRSGRVLGVPSKAI